MCDWVDAEGWALLLLTEYLLSTRSVPPTAGDGGSRLESLDDSSSGWYGRHTCRSPEYSAWEGRTGQASLSLQVLTCEACVQRIV